MKITVTTNPPAKRVFVLWGKKRLGMIMPRQPLIIQRPRDSGPFDLTVQCEGYVPVQTRAFTLADNKLVVKLTPVDQKSTLLGYRQELPPEPDGGASPPAPGTPADAGAPPPLGASPPPTAAPPRGLPPPAARVPVPPPPAPAAPRGGPDAGPR